MAGHDFRCQECSAAFSTQAERELHNRVQHSQYSCDNCDEVFGSEADLQLHNYAEHPQPQGI